MLLTLLLEDCVRLLGVECLEDHVVEMVLNLQQTTNDRIISLLCNLVSSDLLLDLADLRASQNEPLSHQIGHLGHGQVVLGQELDHLQ